MSNSRRRESPYRRREALRSIRAADTSPAPWGGEPIAVHRLPTGVDLLAIDQVALAVADPGAAAAFLRDHVGMQTLTDGPDVTVVGAGSGAATLALVAAEGPREPGALVRLVLRVADVARAAALLPAGTAVAGDLIEEAEFEGPEGLGLGFTLVAGGGIDYDLDHVVLRCSEPERTRDALAGAGCVPRGRALHVADKYIVLAAGAGATASPLLDHITVRVESLDAVRAKARERSGEVGDRAPDGALSFVLPGPEQIGLHFVEHTLRG